MLLSSPKDYHAAARAMREAQSDGTLTLLFVCTHNSRRSQLAEAWAHLIFRNGPGIRVASCGTERTQCHPHSAEALEADGWAVRTAEPGSYLIEREGVSTTLYSKSLDEFLVTSPSIAFMTCAEADEACPAILGAVARFPWRYEDPKRADESPEALATYIETSRAIRRDLELLHQHYTALGL